jgi:hypothetical protein|tara:strand:+ start:69 stop:1178 length:1110 start_codon:yes stop_codon:yes gene_type:complete
MKLLYLSPNFLNYTASLYQLNTYKYLDKYCQLILWGPGFKDFDQKLSLSDVVSKFKLSKNDAICVGHGWLSDLPLNQNNNNQYSGYSWIKKNGIKLNFNILEFCKEYDFNEFNGKKIAILNKEYVSLDKKLEFIKKNNFNLVLCLNPNYKKYENKIGIEFKFWPNAVDHILFNKKNDYKYDLCFSGLIQNYNLENNSKNINKMRLSILKKIFLQFGGIKILKKSNFKNYKIFWNSFSGRRYFDLVLKFTRQYRYLNYDQYLQILSNSKSTINTLGPSGLIGPRYFESMLSNSVCFAEESSLYEGIFIENENYVSFKNDLSDFNEKLNFATSDSKEINKIKKNAYDLVLDKHTYERRAQDLIKWADKINL